MLRDRNIRADEWDHRLNKLGRSIDPIVWSGFELVGADVAAGDTSIVASLKDRNLREIVHNFSRIDKCLCRTVGQNRNEPSQSRVEFGPTVDEEGSTMGSRDHDVLQRYAWEVFQGHVVCVLGGVGVRHRDRVFDY